MASAFVVYVCRGRGLLAVDLVRPDDRRAPGRRAAARCRGFSGAPFELRPGHGLSQAQLVQRLNDVGYAERPTPTAPGEFGVSNTTVTVVPRNPERGQAALVRVDFARANSTVDHATHGRRRQDGRTRRARGAAARRARAGRAAPLRAAREHPATRHRRRPRHRGPPLLRPSRRRSHRHRSARSSRTSAATGRISSAAARSRSRSSRTRS